MRTFVKNPVKPLRPERLGYPYTVLLLPFKFVVLKRFKHLVENFFDRKSFYFLRRKQRVDVHLDAAAFALFVRPLWTEQVTALYAAHDNGQSEKFKQLGYRGARLSATTVAGDFALGIQSNDSFVFGDFLCLTQKTYAQVELTLGNHAHFQPQIFVPQHLIVGNHAVYQTGIHCLMKRKEIKAGLMVYKQDIGRLYL